jgi:acetolactate synthase-1/2/3 large subunit
MFGTGVRISDVQDQLINLAEKYSIPVVTAWTHDTIESEHDNFVGRAGTIGTRPGNIVVQQSDLLIVFGSRLNIRQISYNWNSFAKNAKIIQIDIDSSELKKPFPKIDMPITADLKVFVPLFVLEMLDFEFSFEEWLSWCKKIKSEFDIKPEDYPINNGVLNPYHVIPALIDSSPDDTVIVCGNATACIVPFQTAMLRKGMRIFSNSGSASMGYDLPAAIGASLAGKANVLCFAGDGSVMMNLQELQTLKNLDLNVKLVILDNGGYLSIKQTQENFFGTRYGADQTSGITFPDFEKLAFAFDLRVMSLNSATWKDQIKGIFSKVGPEVITVKLDPNQEFEPRLKSKMVNGNIETPELDDMYPFLSEERIKHFRESPLVLTRRKISHG